MLVLGIESTCDETGCSIVEDGKAILSNVVTSQIDLHNTFGGVVPELACRRHVDVIIPVIEKALKEAGKSFNDIDVIAVAHGPGLVGALMIGVTAAKSLSIALKKPFIGVNHTEAHLYAALMCQEEPVDFPCLGLVISGGHTALLEMKGIGNYRLIGQTVDDAIGEAFDKTAKLLGLPYPGGPEIEKRAKKGNPTAFPFKAGRVKNNHLAFSFSGLKTAVLYATQNKELTPEFQADIAASFQRAAFDDIIEKLKRVAPYYKALVFGGGVTNNQHLKQRIIDEFPEHRVCWPTPALTLDNAAMIAGLGYHQYTNNPKTAPLDLEALPTISF